MKNLFLLKWFLGRLIFLNFLCDEMVDMRDSKSCAISVPVRLRSKVFCDKFDQCIGYNAIVLKKPLLVTYANIVHFFV